MRNLSISITIIFLAGVFAVTGSMIQLQQTFVTHVVEGGGTDPVDLDALNFWSIESSAFREEDPEGWTRFIDGGEMDADMRAEFWAWGLVQRHIIFERRYGFRYEGIIID